MIMRKYYENTTAQLFMNGKVVTTGSKSKEEAQACAFKVAKDVNKWGYSVSVTHFKVCNLVGSHDFDCTFDLSAIAQFKSESSYETELFPGLFYRISTGQKATVFRNGKVFITGNKSIREMKSAFLELKCALEDFILK